MDIRSYCQISYTYIRSLPSLLCSQLPQIPSCLPTLLPFPLFSLSHIKIQIFFISACCLTLSGTINFLSVVIFHPSSPFGFPKALSVFCSTRLYALPSFLSKLKGWSRATGGLVMKRGSMWVLACERRGGRGKDFLTT